MPFERIGCGNWHGSLPYQIVPCKLRNRIVSYTPPFEQQLAQFSIHLLALELLLPERQISAYLFECFEIDLRAVAPFLHLPDGFYQRGDGFDRRKSVVIL